MDSKVLSMGYLVEKNFLLYVFRLCQLNEDFIYLNDSKASSLRNKQQTCQKMIILLTVKTCVIPFTVLSYVNFHGLLTIFYLFTLCVIQHPVYINAKYLSQGMSN